MTKIFEKIQTTHRFYLLGVLGILLVVLSSSAALVRTYGLAYDGKKAEIRHLVESEASTIQSYIDRAKKGELSEAEAQRLAIDAIKSARFEGGNFFFIARWDGICIASVPEKLAGTNRLDEKDGRGNLFYRTIVEAGKQPGGGFISYWLPFPGQTEPEMKVSYVIGFPEWQWSLGTGLYMTSVDSAFAGAAAGLACVIVPLTLLFALILVAMSRDVAKLLRGLTQSMTQVAAGDLEAEIGNQSRSDEIGQMAVALAAFRDAARDKLRLEKETEAQQQRAETERRETADTIQTTANASAHVVDVLAQGLTKLSAGDLTARIDQAFAADYEKLRADFNATAASLQAAMRSISDSAGGIGSGSDQIATATDDLSRRTEQQAANVEQTAAALNLIAGTVKAMAAGAHEAAAVVATARGAAETSGSVVTQAVSAMGKIQESSNQISNIIGVIDEIAFQTNLLALNAGVEAARAGDAGRGFAVVAAEVRALAQRSAEAAKQIKALISASSTQVESGVELVGKTGEALKDIIEKVAAMDALIRQISASSQEQATGLGEISTAVNQMDQAVQQNAAFVEESTAAAHTLKDDTRSLMDMVRRFQTGGPATTTKEPGDAKPAPAKNQARPAPAATQARPAPARITKPAPAAIAKSAANAGGGWEEF